MSKKVILERKSVKVAALLAVTCLVLLIISQKRYYALIAALCGIYAIAITGLDVLFGYTGQISFGHAAFFAIGAYTSALLSTRMAVPSAVAVLAGVLVSIIAGILIAFPASKLVKHFLSLLTTAFGQIVYLVLNSARDFTGGGSGILNIPDIDFGFIAIDTNMKYAVLVWLLVVVVFLIKKNIVESAVGYAFLAIKGNTVAAGGVGINVRKYKVMAFAISAAFTGLAGGLYAHLVGFISPDTFNSTQSTLFMTMLLFGGTCSYIGPILGSMVLIFIREFLQSFSNYQTLIYGLFLLAILFYFPNGVVGIVKRITQRKQGGERDE